METYNPQQVCKCKEFVAPYTKQDSGVSGEFFALLAEAQTSGGLLAAIAPDQAEEAVAALREAGDIESAVIGEVTDLELEQDKSEIYLHITV